MYGVGRVQYITQGNNRSFISYACLDLDSSDPMRRNCLVSDTSYFFLYRGHVPKQFFIFYYMRCTP